MDPHAAMGVSDTPSLGDTVLSVGPAPGDLRRWWQRGWDALRDWLSVRWRWWQWL